MAGPNARDSLSPSSTCTRGASRRPFQKMSGSRIVLFKELAQPVLRSLRAHRYELGAWRQAKANIDYNVSVDWHCYSVPYSLTQQQVEVRLSARTVRASRARPFIPRDILGGAVTSTPRCRSCSCP